MRRDGFLRLSSLLSVVSCMMHGISIVTGDIVHHLYQRGPALDLIPYCGAIPGPVAVTGDWNTGHGRNELLQCVKFGLPVCVVCASPAALGGFTPLIPSDEDGS